MEEKEYHAVAQFCMQQYFAKLLFEDEHLDLYAYLNQVKKGRYESDDWIKFNEQTAWVKENRFDYAIQVTEGIRTEDEYKVYSITHTIVIHDEDKAMAFKLRWS